MWTLVYNSTLLLHWNVNSLWAVHNEAMREFPYWKYYHFTQRSDCIPLKADTNRKRIGCNILTQLHREEDPDQLHHVHHYLNLDVKRQRLSDHMTGVRAIVSFSGSFCFASSCLRWNLHVCLAHRPQAWLEGLVHLFLNMTSEDSSKVAQPGPCCLLDRNPHLSVFWWLSKKWKIDCGLNLREWINHPLKMRLYWATCSSLVNRMHACNWPLKAALINIFTFSLHIPFKHLLAPCFGCYQCSVFNMFHCPQEVKINMHQCSFKGQLLTLLET